MEKNGNVQNKFLGTDLCCSLASVNDASSTVVTRANKDRSSDENGATTDSSSRSSSGSNIILHSLDLGRCGTFALFIGAQLMVARSRCLDFREPIVCLQTNDGAKHDLPQKTILTFLRDFCGRPALALRRVATETCCKKQTNEHRHCPRILGFEVGSKGGTT
jgi:hypothetical protein